jgi:integrase
MVATAKKAPSSAPALDDAGLPMDYAAHAEADNTRLAHSKDLARFLAWGGAIPAPVEMIEAYLSAHAVSHKPATLTRWLASISVEHQRQGLDSPCRHRRVRDVLHGIKRAHGTQQRQVAPAVKNELWAMARKQEDDLVGLRNRALLLVGFGGAMRRSEIGALALERIRFRPDGIEVDLGKTKADQLGEDGVIAIPRARVKERCPVVALEAWLAAAGIREGPVFRPILKSGVVGAGGLSGHSVAAIVKAAALRAGLDPGLYSGHSLRAGLVTSAVQSRKRYDKIKKQTRHRSDAMLERYIRDSELFEDNAADLG